MLTSLLLRKEERWALAMERKSALVGFDGFIDRLSHVVSFRDHDKVREYALISDFAERVSGSAGISCDLELNTRRVAPGGNAPIMAQAMGRLGVDVTLAAAVGEGKPHPVFSKWEQYCDMLPLGNPADTLALEFDDGKVMLADLKSLESLTWQRVKDVIGMSQLKTIASRTSLVALTCYSLLPHGEELFDGFLREVASQIPKDNERFFFFDLADPSKHDGLFIRRCCDVLAAYLPYGRTILGMNQNEAVCIAKAFCLDTASFPDMLEALCEKNIAGTLLMHPRDGCFVCDKKGTRWHQGNLVNKPAVSTGGGDHFNAGVCAALLRGYDIDSAVEAGMRVSHDFVLNGITPISFE